MAYLRSDRATLEAKRSALEHNIGKSHIVLDVLYPAVAGKLLDGSTATSASTIGPNDSIITSSKYGTVQSDGRMYYYTDIKGSKPINDPRIGAQFGSQRHRLTSMQPLEQETAAHGKKVYSVDGRDWIRMHDLTEAAGVFNDDGGCHLNFNDHNALEVTGYFSGFNLSGLTWTGYDPVKIKLDGTNQSNATLTFGASHNSPLWGRFKNAASNVRANLDTPLTTPGIHTVRLWNGSESSASDEIGRIWYIELIVQDTTSTAARSQLQIPSQNVISSGKKRTISGTPRYNPFDQAQDGTGVTINSSTTNTAKLTGGWSGTGSTYYSEELDESTSLGLGAWEHSSTYDDSGDTDHTVAIGAGTPHHTGEYSVIGTTSMHFDGTDVITAGPTSTDWNWGTGGAFTIEFWFRASSFSTSDSIMARRNNASDSTFYIRFERNGGGGSSLEAKINFYNSADHTSGAFSDFQVDTWYHVAFVRNGGTTTCYKNGVLLYSFSDSFNYSSNVSTSSYMMMGARWTGSVDQGYEGWMDEIRVSDSARYSSTFTPSTTAFVSDSNTKLLIHSTNKTPYRPVNGGRVVWWVNSSGTLKCSVNMMPPAGNSVQQLNNTHNVPTGIHNWATAFKPAFSKLSRQGTPHGTSPVTGTGNRRHIDHAQQEIAKSYFVREFSNGSGNGNSNYNDIGMLNDTSNASFVMDDGLTALGCTNVRQTGITENLHRNTSSAKVYFTFIGTGVGRNPAESTGIVEPLATNLPYGSHVLTMQMAGTDTSNWYIDGQHIYDNVTVMDGAYHNFGAQLHIFQPKMPPIPEDACIIADYMLMADFVPLSTAGIYNVSKGTRLLAPNHDVFYDNTAGGAAPGYIQNVTDAAYFMTTINSAVHASNRCMFPAFATNLVKRTYAARTQPFFINDTAHSSAVSVTSAGSGHDSYYHPTANVNLGNNIFEQFGTNAGGSVGTHGFEIASPIHTSSHYQPFETPYTHELIGGDRNLEQRNLVVAGDGTTWDELRDMSYQSNIVFSMTEKTANSTETGSILSWNDYRGSLACFPASGTGIGGVQGIQKDSIMIGRNSIYILKEGVYKIDLQIRAGSADLQGKVSINSQASSPASGIFMRWNIADTSENRQFQFPPLHLHARDYIYLVRAGGTIQGDAQESGPFFQITKLS